MVFKRCFYFDRDGNPRAQGCPRKASCHFVHPNDPDWDQAPDSFPPAYVRQRRSPPPIETRKFEAEANSKDYHKNIIRGAHQDHISHRYNSRDRSEGEVSRYDESIERPQRQNSDHQKQLTPSSQDTKTSPPLPPLTLSNTTIGSPQLAPPSTSSIVPSGILQPSLPVESPLVSLASNMTTFPLPPPPPSTSFWQNKSSSVLPDPTSSGTRTIWLEKIKIAVDCLRNEKQLKKIRKDLAEAKRHLSRQRTATLPAENQRELEIHVNNLESQCSELEKAFESSLSRFIKSMAHQPMHEGQVEESQKITTYLNDLTNKATEMYEALIDIREHHSPPTGPTDMNVDPQGSSSRPLKRRRLSESDPPEKAQSPSVQEIEALRDRVLSVEARFSAFKNDLEVHDAELTEVIEERLDSKLEAHQLGQTAALTVFQDEHRQVQENVTKTGADMDEIASEITDLIKQTTVQEADRIAIRHEIETLSSGFKGFQEKLQHFETNREKNRVVIEALEATVSAHVAQPSPSNLPGRLSHDLILEELEGPILDMVRSHTKPLIETMRSQVEDILRTQNKEMYDVFSSKLALTLRTVEALSSRVETPEKPIIAPGQ